MRKRCGRDDSARIIVSRLSLRTGSQPPLALAPVGQVGVEEVLEDPPVIGGEQVDELVDDDELAEVVRQGEELAVECEATGVRVASRVHTQLTHANSLAR